MARAVPVEIRAATEADLPALEWGGEYSRFRRVYQRAMVDARQGRRLLLLAEAEGSIIGQIFIQFAAGKRARHAGVRTAYLYAFRVKAHLRNRGVGTQLMQVAERIVRQRGFGRVVISVAQVNADARRLYERLDYRVFAQDPGEWSYIDHAGRLQKIREPAFLMEKWLDDPRKDRAPL